MSAPTDLRYLWLYEGEPVRVPPWAEIAPEFRQRTRYHEYVQEILEIMEPPLPGKLPTFETVEGFSAMPLPVVEVEGQRRHWGVHRDHTAKSPGRSPFVTSTSMPMTDMVTIEVKSSRHGIQLVRAYIGDYRPPLPWQGSARDIYDEARDYWRSHAYVDQPGVMIGRYSLQAPEWFSGSV